MNHVCYPKKKLKREPSAHAAVGQKETGFRSGLGRAQMQARLGALHGGELARVLNRSLGDGKRGCWQ
jgi:hypothetical protein